MIRKTICLVLAGALLVPAAAVAQDGDDDGPPTLVVSQWQCPISSLGDIVAESREVSLPVYQGMVDEGLVLSWGVFIHSWGDDWNVGFWTSTVDHNAFFAAWQEAGMRTAAARGDDAEPNPLVANCTAHKDNIYNIAMQTMGPSE